MKLQYKEQDEAREKTQRPAIHTSTSADTLKPDISPFVTMGQGGYLSIYNTTPHEWRKTFQFAYQMNSWDFPATIAPYTAVNIYIEFDEGIFTHTGDDKGEVNYELVGCPAGQAQFQLVTTLRDLNARFIEFPARLAPDTDVPVGGKLNLGWRDDGVAVFILAGQHGNLHVLKNAA